jgi:hypothetical protein
MPRAGTTSLEFAIVAPVMFFIIFGSLELTRMAMLQHMAQDAAYDAARHAMVSGATVQEAIDKANETLDLFNAAGATVNVNGGHGLQTTDQFITVEITIPMEDNALFLRQFFAGRDIVASISLRRERYEGFYSGS